MERQDSLTCPPQPVFCPVAVSMFNLTHRKQQAPCDKLWQAGKSGNYGVSGQT